MNTKCGHFALLLAVHYGDTGPTIRLLRSLSQLEGFSELSISVVNNGPSNHADNKLLSLAKSMPNVSVVDSTENRGYFGGARHGLSLYLENHPLPDWAIVSNVDLLIGDSQFLSRLATLTGLQGVGVVAPGIRSAATGRDQNPFIAKRPSAARMHAYKWIYRSSVMLNAYELAAAAFHRLHGRFGLRNGAGSISAPDARRTIYAPHGSFLIFAAEYFRRGGTFDFPCFLFGEEIYVAETVRALGLEVVYDPSLVVTHQEHATTKLVKPRGLAQAVANSAAYCADTYFSWHK